MRRLLLDTHCLLWTLSKPGVLRPAAREAIAAEDSIVYVSMASLWECAIKSSLGKLGLPPGFFAALEPAGFELLPIEQRHVEAYPRLPMHHRDPFDRMLVVQAIEDQLILMTRDEEIRKYDVTTMDA